MQELMEKALFPNNFVADIADVPVVGTLYREKGETLLKVDGGDTLKVKDALPVNCKEGDRVAARAINGFAVVDETFGASSEAEPNIKAMLRREGLDKAFEIDAVMQGKQTAFTEIGALMAKRVDLRGKTIITISESENSRNECGFSVEINADGDYILGIHTADVVEFVPAGSALERAVYSRCKTAVLPDREIPMLPDTITKGPCFLEVGEDRLAVSYFLTIDEEGAVKDFSFCESVIKTAANCLFSEIDALFLDYDISALLHLRKVYASIQSTIGNMFTLGAILQSARAIKGGADIDKAERHFLYSIHGDRPVGMVFRKDSDPKRLIREFLSIAGQELAAYFHKNGLPAVYRVQAKPDDKAIAAFRALSEAVGVDTSEYSDDKLMGTVIDIIRGIRQEELLLKELRTLLPESGFAAEGSGHFLYNTEMYTRFAYPLNRSADFCNQQTVKAVLSGKIGEEELKKLREKVALCVASDGESRVNRAESIAEDIVALDCLRRDKNKSYTGLVRSIKDGSVTVLLDNGCSGRISSEDIDDTKGGVAVIKGKEYRFGSEISVNYAGVDFEAAVLYLTV